ncbi:MAG: ferritin family protein [bacterium]
MRRTRKTKSIKKGSRRVDELLLSALGSELMAIDFYQKAAEKAQSQAGKRFFTEMAEFEQSHFEHIKSVIYSRDKNAKLEIYAPMATKKKITPEIAGDFEPNKDEIIDVLIIAIKAEKDAKERYLKISRMFSDKDSKQIFINLSEDERLHQNILEEQFYQLSNKGLIIWE